MKGSGGSGGAAASAGSAAAGGGSSGGQLPQTGPADSAIALGTLGGTVLLAGAAGALWLTRRHQRVRRAARSAGPAERTPVPRRPPCPAGTGRYPPAPGAADAVPYPHSGQRCDPRHRRRAAVPRRGRGPAGRRAGPPGWSAAPAPGDGAAPRAADRPYFYLEGAPGTVLKDRLSRDATRHRRAPSPYGCAAPVPQAHGSRFASTEVNGPAAHPRRASRSR